MTYHDVVVVVDGVEYKPSKNYGLTLSCTKAGGWQLYQQTIGSVVERLIGEEYGLKPFIIKVGPYVICDSTDRVKEDGNG